MKTKNTKQVFVLILTLAQFATGLAIAEVVKTAPSAGPVPKPTFSAGAPASSKPVNILAGTGIRSLNIKPTNPVAQYIADICEAARKNPDLCGLTDKNQAQTNCEEQKKEAAKEAEAQCDEESVDQYNQGFQDGQVTMKNRGPGGYIFSPGGRMTCENLCAHMRADDGHTMTCIGSLTDDSRVGSCDSKNQDCICI